VIAALPATGADQRRRPAGGLQAGCLRRSDHPDTDRRHRGGHLAGLLRVSHRPREGDRAMSGGDLVEVRGLTKNYEEGENIARVLKGVDLDVGRGELVALL